MNVNEQNMPLYEGTKCLFAKPMTRGEYNMYRGWVMPANENPHEAGYLVEYADGGKPNDDRHLGYISWSPADVFERNYHLVNGDAAGPVPYPHAGPVPYPHADSEAFKREQAIHFAVLSFGREGTIDFLALLSRADAIRAYIAGEK